MNYYMLTERVGEYEQKVVKEFSDKHKAIEYAQKYREHHPERKIFLYGINEDHLPLPVPF